MSTEAARGAADALRGIGAWGRRIFVAAAVGASCLAILAGVVVYLAADYLRARWALQDALTKADRRINATTRPGPTPGVRPF